MYRGVVAMFHAAGNVAADDFARMDNGMPGFGTNPHNLLASMDGVFFDVVGELGEGRGVRRRGQGEKQGGYENVVDLHATSPVERG
ncbi:hypothetical protein THIARS_80080 [Thiomonas delicata]|uniref:Uncharacterized protein n=1 Tax=Thiomonas delicata TaxID=364030 RepID=A0A238D8C6_THIDL|nr:hypothetical protein THIARS_80080 [Thiomonas delicata]